MLTKNGALFFQLLATKYCKGGAATITKLLPPAMAQVVMAAPAVNSKEPETLFFNSKDWFQTIHYSWFIDPLKKAPESFQKVLLASFPVNIAKSLAPEAPSLPTYSDEVNSFLHQTFYTLFISAEPEAGQVLPKQLLPKNDLSGLLQLSKLELVEIIDLLSMYDLADEVRHIVDRKLLQMIVGRLPQKMQRFLRSCMSQKAKLALAPMHIEQIYKDEQQFRIKMHKRGLQRLSIALSGQTVDFIWHLLHILDTGRSKLLGKQIQREAQPTTPAAKMQLMVALQYINDMRKEP